MASVKGEEGMDLKDILGVGFVGHDTGPDKSVVFNVPFS